MEGSHGKPTSIASKGLVGNDYLGVWLTCQATILLTRLCSVSDVRDSVTGQGEGTPTELAARKLIDLAVDCWRWCMSGACTAQSAGKCTEEPLREDIY